MELRGKYGVAIVYTDEVEASAISQIINLLNQPMAENANVRIMPDVHAGAGCVIGYTAKLTDKVVANLIGVDIGCGVRAWKLGKRSEVGEKFDKLDVFIRNNIPSGRAVRDEPFEWFHNESIKRICKTTNQDYDYVACSVGTLGGGNHFIEIDFDDDDNLWLVIHSGSRNFGLKIANYYQQRAKRILTRKWGNEEIDRIKEAYRGDHRRIGEEIQELKHKKPKIPSGLEWLEGTDRADYLNDMNVAQGYALLNRMAMGELIIEKFYKLDPTHLDSVESIHNYINFEDRIIRKGAISAHRDQQVIIPFNMADGVIIGVGKGNPEWNYSAPHGAGRRMSRSAAKQNILLEDFQKVMKAKGVWTSTADKHTLDEAPQAYKSPEHIIKYLVDTVDIKFHMKPVYNFKAAE